MRVNKKKKKKVSPGCERGERETTGYEPFDRQCKFEREGALEPRVLWNAFFSFPLVTGPWALSWVIQQSMSLKYEPASEQLHWNDVAFA